MERKLNAELWDKMHYLFRDFNDRMVHAEMNYDFVLDVDAFSRVKDVASGNPQRNYKCRSP